jgi:hypothetical protein
MATRERKDGFTSIVTIPRRLLKKLNFFDNLLITLKKFTPFQR